MVPPNKIGFHLNLLLGTLPSPLQIRPLSAEIGVCWKRLDLGRSALGRQGAGVSRHRPLLDGGGQVRQGNASFSLSL